MRHIAKYFPNNLDWCGDEMIPSISMDSRLYCSNTTRMFLR